MLIAVVILLICDVVHSIHLNEYIRGLNKFADHEGKTSSTGLLIFVIIILLACIITPIDLGSGG